MSPKRIVVSGASGLIGSALAKALSERGDEVIRLVRGPHRASTAGEIPWDPDAAEIDAAALSAAGPIDAVINLNGTGIADARWSPARKDAILGSRVRSTATLASAIAALDEPPGVFVSGSAIGVYGNRGDEVLTEESTAGTGFLAEVCLAWEGAASPAVDAGIRTAFARTGIVLAAKGGALARQLPLFRLGLGGRLGSGAQWFSWISLRDEVRALCTLIDDVDVSGAVNLTAPSPVTNAEFTKDLGAAMGRPTLLSVPTFALKAVLGAELASEGVLASQRVLPHRLTELGFAFSDEELPGALSHVLS